MQTKRVEAVRSDSILPHLEVFFDRDHDGKVTLRETYDGLRRLDIGRLSSAAFAVGINFGLGVLAMTNPLALDLEKVARTRHPGDSGAVDDRGVLRKKRIDEVFARHARKYGDALTWAELVELGGSDLLRDGHFWTWPRDAAAVLGEWGLFFKIGAEEREGEQVLTRRRVHDLYTDPTLFDRLASENQAKRETRAGTLGGRLENVFHAWIF
jgi:peroxygenase